MMEAIFGRCHQGHCLARMQAVGWEVAVKTEWRGTTEQDDQETQLNVTNYGRMCECVYV